MKTLYRVFPEIKAFGCCHEVFGTQQVLMKALKDICDIEVEKRAEIKVNPVAVNHFTWITKAQYKNMDLFPVYEKFCLGDMVTSLQQETDTWQNFVRENGI